MGPRRRVGPVVIAVQLAVLLAALDSTIVGTALPTVIAALGGAHLYPWAFSIYMLASTVVMPIFGSLSDRLGRRGPFIAATLVFCAGSVTAAAAGSMLVMIAGRGLQGVGAGGIMSLALIIFGHLFGGPRRGQMQGLITLVWGVASIVGPLVGGVIVDGRAVVEAHRQSFVDEARLFRRVQEIGERLLARTGVTLPRSRWPVV